MQTAFYPGSQQVVPHPPSAVGAIAVLEVRSDLRAQSLVTAGAALAPRVSHPSPNLVRTLVYPASSWGIICGSASRCSSIVKRPSLSQNTVIEDVDMKALHGLTEPCSRSSLPASGSRGTGKLLIIGKTRVVKLDRLATRSAGTSTPSSTTVCRGCACARVSMRKVNQPSPVNYATQRTPICRTRAKS